MNCKTAMLSACFLTVLFLGSAWAQGSIADNFDQANATFQSNQEEFNKAEKIGQDAFRNKCIANNASESYNETMAARKTLETCLTSHVNVTKVQEEMAASRHNGSLDEVFKKYCAIKDDLRKCLSDFTDTMKPCLKQQERDNLKIVHNITQQLADFVCFKEGDRIALFIAEKGPECLTQMNDEIQNCVHKATGIRDQQFSAGNISASDVIAIELDFSPERCDSLKEMQACVVQKLQGCEQPTPSNIAEALFKYVIEATPCSKITAAAATKVATTGSAASLSSVLATLASALATLALL